MSNFSDTVRLIRLFVSSPGDVEQERDVLEEVIASINRTDGSRNGFRLEVFRWEVDVVPQIGPQPQEVVDNQTPAYEIYLGIMWARFGGGGTTKEFRDALQSWQGTASPWVMFYFNDAPQISRKPKDVEQYLKVCEFREQLESQGIVKGYSGLRGKNGFYEQTSEHLRKLAARIVQPAKDAASKRQPQQESSDKPSESIDYYLKRLTEETATLTMLGMGRSLQVELPIAEAYVPLRTTIARSMEERKTDRYNEVHAEHHADVDLGEVFRKATEFDQRGIVLLGEPGSGKTTGARQLAWKLASRESRPEDLGLPHGITPVVLRFRKPSRRALADKNGIRTFLDEETHLPRSA